jgi:hypothetical protein
VRRFSRTCLPTCFLLATVWTLGNGNGDPIDPKERTLEILRNNSTLRDYYRRQAFETYSSNDPFGRRRIRASPDQLERHTDRLIEHFHDRLVKNLEDLDAGFREARQARTAWLAAPRRSPERRLLWSESRKALDEVAGSAGDLRRLLSFPLVSLDSRDRFEPEIPPESAAGGFEREFSFLEEELTRAVEEIRNYFLAPTHTVSVGDLRSTNMMILLHRVREMARALSRIEPSEPAS